MKNLDYIKTDVRSYIEGAATSADDVDSYEASRECIRDVGMRKAVKSVGDSLIAVVEKHLLAQESHFCTLVDIVFSGSTAENIELLYKRLTSCIAEERRADMRRVLDGIPDPSPTEVIVLVDAHESALEEELEWLQFIFERLRQDEQESRKVLDHIKPQPSETLSSN